MAKPRNESSPTKRRGRDQIASIKAEIIELLRECSPMTCRQLFYQLVPRGVIAKTEREYKSTVCRLLARMRRSGEIGYRDIADNTRWMRKPRTHSSLESMLADAQKFYRRALWAEQQAYCEIWLEKDALSSVLYKVTQHFDVPLMVTRGYPSLSFLHSAAEVIREERRPVHLFYFGDHDPSGVDIPRVVEQGIREMAPAADVHFTRVAVTAEQIEQYGLPTRPTKKSDSRAKGFRGESVEVDAIHPRELQRLCSKCIEGLIDPERLANTRRVERAERQTLRELAAGGLR